MAEFWGSLQYMALSQGLNLLYKGLLGAIFGLLKPNLHFQAAKV
jgi:hypothetical protein